MSATVTGQDCESEMTPGALFQAHWYAAYTCVHREKRVAELLQAKRVQCFLPLYEEVHNWKTGFERLQLPLFPGYVFVRLPLADRLPVLTTPGVVRLVGAGNRPAPVPEQEIEAIRSVLTACVRITPYPYLTVGQKVVIIGGPLCGLQGILLRRRSQARVVVSLNLIMRSVAADVEVANCAPADSMALSAIRKSNIRAAA